MPQRSHDPHRRRRLPSRLLPRAILAAAIWAFVGTVAYSTFWADLTLLAFWVRSIEPINDLAAACRGAGQYPRLHFPRTLQIVVVSFAPAALIGSFPAEQLLNPTTALSLAPVVLIGWRTVTVVIWRRGLPRYESASS
ncbi:ABC-2 family transporter protein [Propionicimonas sp.]|uniref:ABC-2 family transporter protein n=1 Tax=Propionicimonas sp. TaxID=1955623 RepID=UPI0039E6B6AD